MRWFVAIWLCSAAQWASGEELIRKEFFNGTKLDKLAVVNEILWAAGEGSVFLYDFSLKPFKQSFRDNGQGEVLAISPLAVTARENKSKPVFELGLVCFARSGGLCAVYDVEHNRSFFLNDNMPINHAASGSLLSLLQHHGKGSPLLFATNQNTKPVNEVPLRLVELDMEDYLAKTTNDSFKLNLRPYRNGTFKETDSYSISFRGWTKSEFPPIHYLYSFSLNESVYIVTVQPLVDTSRKLKFETRIARFCLDDHTMTTYTEVPVRCKNEQNVFELAVQARLVNHGKRFLLFMTMGRTDKNERYPDPSEGSAICVFDMKSLGEKFESTIIDCSHGSTAMGVRRIKYYEKSIGTGPLVCEQKRKLPRSCDIQRKNKYIISMTAYEGDVVFATQRVPGETYIYNATRTRSAPVGVLTAFEVDTPELTLPRVLLFIWAADHLGQLHRILYFEKDYESLPAESMLLITVPRPTSKNGFGIESIHFHNRTMFLIDGELFSTNTEDHCAPYGNCGDCLNSRTLTHSVVSCAWNGGRCVPEPKSNDLGSWDSVCKPAVLEKGPFIGPQRGGTFFKIKGFDLGSEEQAVEIKFGSQRCKILQWDSLSRVCEVPALQDVASEVNVTLSVKDHRIDVRMKNYHISTEGPMLLGQFSYYSVEFFGVHPSFGPRVGGTELRLVGKNIGRLGSNARYGLFGDGDQLICKEFVVRNDSELLCNSTQFLAPKTDEEKTLSLSLKIDGVPYNAVDKPELSQVFVYQPDPSNIKLTSSTKRHFFAQGSRSYPIHYTGEHLDAAAFPKLVVKPLGLPRSISAPCISNFSMIICQAPPLSGVDDFRQPLPATVTLQIDNFQFEEPDSRITYYPNATITLTNGGKFVADGDGPARFMIRGKNLLPLEKDDVTIHFDDRPCEIEAIEDNGIQCSCKGLTAGEHAIHVNVRDRKYSALRSSVVIVGRGLGWAATAAIVVVSLILLVLLTLLTVRFGLLRKKVVKAEPTVTYTPENDGYLHPDNERLLAALPPDPELINQLSEEGLLMDFSLIQVGALIGKGQFGCVYHGVLKRDKLAEEEQVAVKMLQQRGYTANDTTVFLKEALRMKDFNHQNVLQLIGVSFDNNQSSDPMIIVPYMANGDLLTYIRDQNSKPTVKDLITFGANIALGMAYLTTQKFVHRDLAARNCMLGEDLIVRIADFGLSRDVYETSYYSSDNSKTKLPVKWMAVESLVEGVYSHKSDVWSYGVLLWELMTRGCVPYPNVDNWDVHNWLKAGRRMLQPNFCPDALYKIMMACWEEDPKKRPTFSQLVKDVPNVIHTIEMASRNQVPSYVNV